ncbi:hypothetical protein A5J11_14065 (plasmid) [Staphylococcus aureus]|nr:hypothetical protein A5J11_14065 [Staphylococcus aureus]
MNAVYGISVNGHSNHIFGCLGFGFWKCQNDTSFLRQQKQGDWGAPQQVGVWVPYTYLAKALSSML